MDVATHSSETDKIPILTPAPALSESSWFAKQIQRGKCEIFTEVVLVTPEIAARLLEQNLDNRKPKEPTISAIARDIKAGHWELNGEAIIISREGWLNDGQNRLLAIIRAGEPVETLMTFGVTRKSRLTVDMGSSRSAADFLGMQGNASAVRLSLIARLNLILKSGSSIAHGGVATKQDTIAHFNLRKDEILRAYEAVGASNARGFAGSVRGHGYLPVAWMNIRAVDARGCETFFERLEKGANLDADDPILWLRARLVASVNTKESIRNEGRLEIVLRYWNAWAEGARLKRHIGLTGKYPRIVPSKR